MAFAGDTREMITLNLASNSAGFDFAPIVQLCLRFSLFFSYPLMLFPLTSLLEERYSPGKGKAALLRLGLVLLTAVIIVALPSFADLLEVIGAVCCSLVAFVMPALCFWKLFGHECGVRRKFLAALMTAVGGTAMALGVADVIAKMSI